MRTGQLELEYGTQAALDRAGEWVTQARTAVGRLASTGMAFDSDDLRDLIADPPNPNAIGALFRSCIHDGLIVEVGTTRSRRPDAHGRRIGRYRRAS